MEKIAYFKNEIELIQTPKIKEFLKNAINDIPDYFFEVPASSSGKHHPDFALGKGGLSRHTQATIVLLQHYLGLEELNQFTQVQKDLLVCALVLHDSRKSGENYEYVGKGEENEEIYITKTDPMHPKLAAKAIIKNKENIKNLSMKELRFFIRGITSHMGQWNTDFNKKVILPKPDCKYRTLIHHCDYFASRKNLEVKILTENVAEK